MRYNVMVERYNTCREIECRTIISMVNNHVLPAAISYKERLSTVISNQKGFGLESSVEVDLYKRLSTAMENLYAKTNSIKNGLQSLAQLKCAKKGETFARELLPLCDLISQYSNELEEIIPDDMWPLPTYYDMLFLR